MRSDSDKEQTLLDNNGLPVNIFLGAGTILLLLLALPHATLGQNKYASFSYAEGAHREARGQFDDRADQGQFIPKKVQKAITLRLKGATLKEAIEVIAEKADLQPIYGSHQVLLEQRVTLESPHITVLEALKKVIETTDLQVLLSRSGRVVIARRTDGLTKIEPAGIEVSDMRNAIPLQGVRSVDIHEIANLQTGTIAGTVVDSANGEPLPGVNVVVVGAQQGASTDVEGTYRIAGVEAGVYDLRATFVGYAPQTVENVEVVEDETTIVDFSLQASTMQLEEIVAIGYGTAQRKDLTGSVGSIDAADVAEVQTIDNVAQLLQGRVPGLNAGVATEAGGRSNLEIRGRNSIQASNDPLIVVDGVPYSQGDLDDINPNDVESIDVLKGASAAAVYGSSAAAGVIEVTTKQGTTPEPTIRFKSSAGVATQGDIVEPYGPEEFVRYRQDARQRLDRQAPEHYFADPRDLPSGITLEEWKALGQGSGEPVEVWLSRLGFANNEIQNYLEGNTVDWHDRVFRSAAVRQNYNLSIGGKPENMSYYWSLGYVDNQGEHVGDRFKTIRSRLNLEAGATDWLDVGLRSQYANRNEGFLGANPNEAAEVSPYGDIYGEDGRLKWYPHEDGLAVNPFLWTSESGRRYEWRNHNLLATVYGNVHGLPFGFDYELRWTNNYDFRRRYIFNPSSTPMGEPAGRGSRREITRYVWQVDNILSWEHTLASIHEFDATFLFNVEVQNSWLTNAHSDQFALETLGYSGLPLGENPSVNSDDRRTTGNALMGRLNYRLLDRYLFTVSYRRDGFSAFGQSNPYAYFPSAAFAWRISEEPFFGFDPVSNLKLRLSWGVNGNRSIGTYAALQRMNTTNYLYGTNPVIGISSSNLPNANLRWERTSQYNAGLDFGLISNRLTGSLDAYYMSTSDLLLRRSLPNVTGYDNIVANLGEVVNRGVELSFNSINVQTETVNWSSMLTFSLNRNEIKHLYGTMVPVTNEEGEVIGEREADDRQNGWFIGHALDEIYDYEVLGVWQQEEAEQAAEYGREPGDFKLRDVNGDGALSPLEDKVFQGYTEPRYRLSLGNDLSYRRFTASAMITSYLGHYTAHNIHKHGANDRYDGRLNQPAFPYWTPDNPTNEWARLASEGQNPSFTYWENSSFVKLQSVSLAYRIPERFVNSFSASGLRVFFNARNVVALSGFDGDDPETHQNSPRLYTLGVNLAF